jgi:hypothetical protein
VPVTELMLEAALQDLSPEGRKVLILLVRSGAMNASCNQITRLLGARNRYALSRWLRRSGLPSYRELLGWLQVLTWVVEWEDRRTSLSAQAFDTERYPSTLYRTVRRVTGTEWSQVQAKGSLWVLLQLVDRCRSRARLEDTLEPPARAS